MPFQQFVSYVASPCNSGPSILGLLSKLLNGMCSKGPLVGIVPQRSLFETSITLRLEIFVSSLGTGPVKWLSLSRLEKNRKSEGGKKVNRLTY